MNSWEQMAAVASDEVRALRRALPEPVRRTFEGIPVVFEKKPGRALRAEGIEPDTLGLFEGANLREEEGETPRRIVLFLDNIRDAAEGDEAEFREEIRTTLLHELGHYLGLEEDGLIERDLE
ncbi:MAG: metallopeptidase family protein [Lentisphaerae bacterium]|nr:metallopeptidase family protein [Lentisphaerota bacterium]